MEFNDEEVASIVAEAMNGYFLLEKRLVCHVLPRDKVYDLMFKRPKKVMSKREIQNKARAEVNRRKTPEVMKGITAKLVQREEAKRKKLADLGFDYDFPGYAAGAKAMQTSGDKKKKDGPSKKKRKVSMDDKENSADEEENSQVQQKTPKASKKTASKANTEVKKDKKKKDKKRKSLA